MAVDIDRFVEGWVEDSFDSRAGTGLALPHRAAIEGNSAAEKVVLPEHQTLEMAGVGDCAKPFLPLLLAALMVLESAVVQRVGHVRPDSK